MINTDGPEPWFRRAADVTAPVRLFYFPYAGGNAAHITGWQARLGTAVELQVAQLPGHGARLLEEPLDDLDTLVAHLAAAVADLADRRFAFFGHSLGALVAFEVARSLRRQGLPMPERLWASGAEAPRTRLIRRRIANLPQDELIEALRDYSGAPAEVLADQEIMELLLPGIRADFTLSERYAYRAEPPLDLPIHVLRGTQDPYVEATRAADWAQETIWSPSVRVYPGDHFFITPHDADIASLVVTELSGQTALSGHTALSGQRPNPYQSLPSRSFWRTAVAEPAAGGSGPSGPGPSGSGPSGSGVSPGDGAPGDGAPGGIVSPLASTVDIGDVWQPKFTIGQDDPILTAGSCFAAHIGRRLLEAGMNWHDAEPAPPGLTAEQRQARHYGQFSFRTGNIYTAAMMRQWLSWALGEASPPDGAWAQDGRYFDPYRPSVEPDGYPSEQAMLDARALTLKAIAGAIGRASCLVLTLGLTEAWHDTRDGTVYPSCPGTVRGSFDEQRHAFRNAAFADVREDLSAAISLARTARADLRVVLTVSPVPLTATATGGHVLVATTYSKSVLRSVAGELAAELDHVDYFPSYELITGSPFRASYFEPNLRTVTSEGVAFVMRHFLGSFGPRPAAQGATMTEGGDPACDDAVLDYYRPR